MGPSNEGSLGWGSGGGRGGAEIDSANLKGEVRMGDFDALLVSVGEEGEAGLHLPPGLQGAHPYPQLPHHPLLLHPCRAASYTAAISYTKATRHTSGYIMHCGCIMHDYTTQQGGIIQ